MKEISKNKENLEIDFNFMHSKLIIRDNQLQQLFDEYITNKLDIDPHFVNDNYFNKEDDKKCEDNKKESKEGIKNIKNEDINSKSCISNKNENEYKMKLNVYESKLSCKSQIIEDKNPLQVIEIPNNCFVCKAIPNTKSTLKKCYSNNCQNHFCNDCYYKNEYQIRETKCDCKYFTCETCDSGKKQCIMSTVYCSKCNKRYCHECFRTKHHMHSN